MSVLPIHAPCIRRWYSIYSTCRCEPCKTMRARAKKRYACNPTAPLAPRQQARDVLLGFLARDWSPTAVASATGIVDKYADQLLTLVQQGAAPKVGPAIAAAIINHGQPTRGYVTAIGSRRKIRALAYIGYSNQMVATKAGLAMNTVAKIRAGSTRRVKPAVAEQIDIAWKALWMTPGPSDRTRKIAAANGWASPMHWADIDNPECVADAMAGTPATEDAA